MNDISKLSYDTQPKLVDKIAKMSGYEETVPDIETFIKDPFYLGKVLGDGLYPIWLEASKKLFPNPYAESKEEIILTGGIGLGKSTFALLISFYDLCKVLSLKNPHKYYNLIESTVISIAFMNATKNLASGVLYDQAIEWIENSPYFKSKLAPKPSRTLFVKNIHITVGSRGKDMLGQAIIGAIFSEINSMNVVHGQAEDNFDTISTRRKSRFGKSGKVINGHLILDSSNKGSRSFIDDRIEEKQRSNTNDYITLSYSHWDAIWHEGKYSGQMFKVFCGNESRDPFIIEEDTDPALIKGLDSSRIIEVPVEHHQDFKFNIVKSIRDLAGVSTFSIHSFIPSTGLLVKCCSRANPVNSEKIVLDFFDKTQKLENYIDLRLLAKLNDGLRFIHIDLGLKNDSTGIASTYVDGFIDVKNYDVKTGKTQINREPRFVTEWVMEIMPVPGQEVPIYKIKEFILSMSKLFDYPVETVSTDGFQSSNIRQDLTLKGINSKLISVDRTKDPYEYTKDCIMEERLTTPNLKKLLIEFRELEENEKKVDHPDTGSKDLTDAVTGSVWSAYQHLVANGSLATKSDRKELLTSLLDRSINKQEKFENMLTDALMRG